MHAPFLTPRHCRRAAFSLIEITLSLGIAVFAVSAIMSLLAVTLRNSRTAADDTIIAEMTNDLASYFQQQTFDTVPSTPVVFFDNNGKRVNEIDPANGALKSMTPADAASKGAVYKCGVATLSDPETETKSATGPTSTNLWRVTLNFTWPASAAKPDNAKTIHLDLARH